MTRETQQRPLPFGTIHSCSIAIRQRAKGKVMSNENTPPPEWMAMLGALIIAIASGFISIAQRIIRGHNASLLWVLSEFTAAILFGYLMYNAYPDLEPYLPPGITVLVAVSFAAHMGGRCFQGLENYAYRKYGIPMDDKPPKRKRK